MKVAALIGRVEQAVRDVQHGVDIIIAQGYEAGGHTGEVATMVLVPDVVDAIAPGARARRRRHRVGPADGGGDGPRRRRRVDGVDLAHRDRERVEPGDHREAAGGHVDRHRALPGAHRQAGPHAAHRRGPRPGRRPSRPAPLPMPLQFLLNAYANRKMGGHAPRELVGMPVGQIVSRMNSVRTTKQVVFEMVEEYIDVTTKLAGDLEDA